MSDQPPVRDSINQTIAHLLTENVKLKNERGALLRALGLDPVTGKVPEAVAVIEALMQWYEDTRG